MIKHNDIVKGLKGAVQTKDNGKKKAVVKVELLNKLGYDGCGTHTHQ